MPQNHKLRNQICLVICYYLLDLKVCGIYSHTTYVHRLIDDQGSLGSLILVIKCYTKQVKKYLFILS